MPYTNLLLLRLTFLLIIVGTGLELWFIGHYEDNWQVVPMVLLGLALSVFLLTMRSDKGIILTVFKVIMMLCIVSGLVGIFFHFQANLEFEQEMYPGRSGIELLLESLSGAIPALAPGSMTGLGLLGYFYSLYISENNQTK